MSNNDLPGWLADMPMGRGPDTDDPRHTDPYYGQNSPRSVTDIDGHGSSRKSRRKSRKTKTKRRKSRKTKRKRRKSRKTKKRRKRRR